MSHDAGKNLALVKRAEEHTMIIGDITLNFGALNIRHTLLLY